MITCWFCEHPVVAPQRMPIAPDEGTVVNDSPACPYCRAEYVTTIRCTAGPTEGMAQRLKNQTS